MVEIHWTQEADFWLREIHDYIALDNKKTAKKVVSEIFQKVQVLSHFPQIGYIYQIIEEEKEVRILLYGHYRIAYLVKDKTRIDILGIFHGALKIEHYLQRRSDEDRNF